MKNSMVRVGFYLENSAVREVDFARPELGNPGSGGTEFLFASLPHYLGSNATHSCEPVLFANVVDKLSPTVRAIQAVDVIDAARKAKKDGCELFVYRPRLATNPELLQVLDQLDLPTIAWLHITPKGDHMRALARTKSIKALVCVEQGQYDLARDTAAWRKLTYIVNGFDLDGFKLSRPPQRESNLVVYLGALVEQKGFHVVARTWKRIVELNPAARLVVIGTGALYDANAELGTWGIAERRYEDRYIIPFLSGPAGDILPSVTFAGRLGLEKKALLGAATVGVANPTGQTENCPASVLEFSAMSTPVVSGAYYGILDTVIDGETGLLGVSDDDFVRNVTTLLRDPKRAAQLGAGGERFVRARYGYDHVVGEWLALFDRLRSGARLSGKPAKLSVNWNKKAPVALNRYLQMTLGAVMPWPSVIEMKIALSGLLRRGS